MIQSNADCQQDYRKEQVEHRPYTALRNRNIKHLMKLLEQVTVYDDYLEFRFKSGVTVSVGK